MIAPAECIHELAPGTCSVCTGRGEEKPEPRDSSRFGEWFGARFNGRCGDCDERIHEGDRIRWDGESAYLCESCGGET